jgi:hypothetical protein
MQQEPKDTTPNKVVDLPPRFGPFLIGTLLGAIVAVAIAAFGLQAINAGRSGRSHTSVLIVAFGITVAGAALGVVAEQLVRHPALAKRVWLRHAVRPILYCSVPYMIVAASVGYFGDPRLVGGFWFFYCVVGVPFLGLLEAFNPRHHRR